MMSSAKLVSIMSKIDKIAAPNYFFFKFIGPADKEDIWVLEVRQRAKQTVVISRQVETEPEEAHSDIGGDIPMYVLTCSSTVLTVQPMTMFVTETIQPWGSPRFLHHTWTQEVDLQNAEYRYRISHPRLRLGSGVWVGLALGLQLELLMAFMWCGAKKKYCQKSIGIGIGNTFQQQYWYWYWQYFSQVLLTTLHQTPKCNLLISY